MESRNPHNIALQIAYYKLSRFCLSVQNVQNCQYYDYVALTPNSTRFAIKVFLQNVSSSSVNTYMDSVRSRVQVDPQLGIHIIMLKVNIDSGYITFRKVLTWEYDSPKLHDLRGSGTCVWDQNSTNIFFAGIDGTICVLPKGLWSIKRTITFENGYSVVYFRKIDSYAPSSLTQDCDEDDNNANTRNNFPPDLLDDCLFDAISKDYPGARREATPFILNTHLKQIQHIHKERIKEAAINLVPSYDDLLDFLSNRPSQILPKIPITMVMPILHNSDPIKTIFMYECNLNKITEIESLQNTYIPLKQYIL